LKFIFTVEKKALKIEQKKLRKIKKAKLMKKEKVQVLWNKNFKDFAISLTVFEL